MTGLSTKDKYSNFLHVAKLSISEKSEILLLVKTKEFKLTICLPICPLIDTTTYHTHKYALMTRIISKFVNQESYIQMSRCVWCRHTYRFPYFRYEIVIQQERSGLQHHGEVVKLSYFVIGQVYTVVLVPQHSEVLYGRYFVSYFKTRQRRERRMKKMNIRQRKV